MVRSLINKEPRWSGVGVAFTDTSPGPLGAGQIPARSLGTRGNREVSSLRETGMLDVSAGRRCNISHSTFNAWA